MLQFNSLVLAYIIGSEWLSIAGFFSYYGQTLESVGYSITTLIISGTIDAAAVLLLLGVLILIEIRRHNRPGWWYWLVAPLPAVLAILLGQGLRPGLPRPPEAFQPLLPTIFILVAQTLGFATLTLLARAVVNGKRSLRLLAVAMTIAIGLVLTTASYESGYNAARRSTILDSAVGFSKGLGFATAFFPVVRVAEGSSDSVPANQCGRLLGVGQGAYVIWYRGSLVSQSNYISGSNGVWRLPVDGTTLEPCASL